MKFLAFVDAHGNKKILGGIEHIARKESIDFLICAGDISLWGRNLKGILQQLDGIGTPLLIVPGNHESENELKGLCKEFKNIVYIHKGSYELKYGKHYYLFFGYGGGGFSLIDREFERTANKFIELYNRIKKEQTEKGMELKLILVTHAPPYGTTLDKLDGYKGCKSIRKFIEQVKPAVHICGHLHENAGNIDIIGKTQIVNPGKGKIIEIK